ncbi:hypothetical protein FJT64_016524 [Amphibalanus amphitrite]|uniref:Uncharacterized protein n=1 Tax=Amphibalanus amphitrite TaxID=1232801 RepID=A0A6A4X9D3_AMPAM|nr:hypothetical protein FJT64_016524 [Amphibalanus amphitrite]
MGVRRKTRRVSRYRRHRLAGRQGRTASREQYQNAVAVTHAVAHWRWRAQPHRHLTTGSEPDRDLPESMQPELPAHSRWLWNAKNGDLFWQTDDDNPVELFYQTSLGEEAIKKQIGLFGKRYKQYPNPATMACPRAGTTPLRSRRLQDSQEMPNVNHFLLSIIEYFHHYFKERKLSEMAQQHNCPRNGRVRN